MKIERNNKHLLKELNNFLIDYFRWLAVFLVLTVFSIGMFFVVLPKYQEVSREINETLSDQSNKYRALQQYIGDLRRVNAEYRAIDPHDLERMKKFLPTSPEADDLLIQLEALGAKMGVPITNIMVNADGGAGGSNPFGDSGDKADAGISKDIGRVKISLGVKDVDYNLMKDFLRALESNLRLFDVYDLGFNPASGGMNYTLYAYYLKSGK